MTDRHSTINDCEKDKSLDIIRNILPTCSTKIKQQILSKACQDQNIPLITMMLDEVDASFNDSLLLRNAAAQCMPEIIEILLPHCDAKAYDSEALRWAVDANCMISVQLLLPFSDPHALHSMALQFAADKGNLEMVQILAPVSDPKAGNSAALQRSLRHPEIFDYLYPLSDGKQALEALLRQNTPEDMLENLRRRIAQEEREVISEDLPIKEHSFGKKKI